MNQNYSVKKVLKSNLKDVYSLLQSLNLPTDGIKDHLNNFYVIMDMDKIIGVGGVEIYSDAGLLRSIAINPQYQKKGLGRKIIEFLIDHAKKNKVKELFLLTETVPKLYEKFGFFHIKMDDMNNKIINSEEFNGSCPYTADLMKKYV